jgi:RNA ligase
MICDANDNFTFYETKHIIDGYNISIFNYRLAMPPLFYNPIPNISGILAHELRGLTFVFNADGSLFNRFLLLDKFFNLNQADCSAYNVVKHKTIKEITFKEDGSLLSFIKLPNNKVVAKTKASFEADQAVRAQTLYETNDSIKTLVNWCLDNQIVPIFEYVSPTNRIVLKYNKTDLVLTKLRNNITGEYISIKSLSSELLEGVTIVKSFNNLSLDDLIEKCETEIGYEGFVVQFEDDQMIKLKLFDYIALHNLHTEELHREDYIIHLIINEQIDDVLAQLEEGDERRKMVFDIIDVVNHHLKRTAHEVSELLKHYNGSRKDFAITYRKHPYFHYAARVLNGNDMATLIKDKVLDDTYRLGEARNWINNEKQFIAQNWQFY